MINDELKFIFIHIPKTGGSSIEQIFGRENRLKDKTVHAPLSVYDLEKYKDYYKFSFVRNPWDKLVSEYFWFTNNKYRFPTRTAKNFYRKHAPTFVDFVPLFLNNKMGHKPHRMHYFWFLHPIDKFDFIGKLENFQEDFNTVCDGIGIPHRELPHKFKTEHKPYWEYYDDETRDMVYGRYEADIEHFGYEFGK